MKKKTKYVGIYILSLLCLVYPFYTLIEEKNHKVMLPTLLLIMFATIGLGRLLKRADQD